jgi:glyoxylase-like metal-dependent hydrolase (beta-lactamase superfamily II)
LTTWDTLVIIVAVSTSIVARKYNERLRSELMAQEILPNLYRIEVPLPRNPLRAVNSYIIKADGKSLIIDTGMNREECISVLSSGLKELDVDLNKADFFITHLHADHLGLVSTLATDTAKVYFSQADADIINAEAWEEYSNFAVINGFPENEVQRAIQSHPGFKYGTKDYVNFHILQEGDTISIGDYLFKCIETPGHSPGHICLYEPDKKIFISGDHILSNITPNISLFSNDENPLQEYLTSLDKVYNFNVRLVLPGHRAAFTNFRERIQELKHHHQVRANEVLSILEKENNKDAFQVASQMTWDMSYESWELFPLMQKWFATGEASAHLKYLEEEGKIRREIKEQKVVFSLQ